MNELIVIRVHAVVGIHAHLIHYFGYMSNVHCTHVDHFRADTSCMIPEGC